MFVYLYIAALPKFLGECVMFCLTDIYTICGFILPSLSPSQSRLFFFWKLKETLTCPECAGVSTALCRVYTKAIFFSFRQLNHFGIVHLKFRELSFGIETTVRLLQE
jgi:hypothetical protein